MFRETAVRQTCFLGTTTGVSRMKRGFVASTVLFVTCLSGVAVLAGEPATIGGITQPSERRTFAFEAPGIVSKVLVKDGQPVKSGEVLVQQESRMDQRELEVRRIDAESTVEADSARKEYDLRKVQYERIAERAADGGFTQKEVEEARITMELAQLKIAEAEQKRLQAQAMYERQKLKVELMQIVNQIDGIVEKINVDAGEMADPQKPEGALSVVKNDPLWVEVPLLKTWQVARLSLGQELDVRHTLDPSAAWEKARIIYIAPVADARSGTQMVRLELANPGKRSSGLDVEVKLPPELTQDPTAGRTALND
jgi:RND family efflux transporter MFP subunit